MSKLGHVKQSKEHAMDMPLSQCDLYAIEMLLRCRRNGPFGSRSGRPVPAAHIKDIETGEAGEESYAAKA